MTFTLFKYFRNGFNYLTNFPQKKKIQNLKTVFFIFKKICFTLEFNLLLNNNISILNIST